MELIANSLLSTSRDSTYRDDDAAIVAGQMAGTKPNHLDGLDFPNAAPNNGTDGLSKSLSCSSVVLSLLKGKQKRSSTRAAAQTERRSERDV